MSVEVEVGRGNRLKAGYHWGRGFWLASGVACEIVVAMDDKSMTDRRQFFAALLSAWNAAIVVNDAEAIGRFADPDWIFVGADGVLPGKAFLEAVASGRVTHDFMTSEVFDVREVGDVAVVVARVRNSGTYEGRAFQADEWTTDVFLRKQGGWLCTLTQITAATEPTRG